MAFDCGAENGHSQRISGGLGEQSALIAMTNRHLSDRTAGAACCTNLSDDGNWGSWLQELWNGAGCFQKRGMMIGREQQGSHPSQETMGEAACRMTSFLTVPLLIILASSILL